MEFGVYLAGPINGCSDEEAYGWRRDIKQVFKEKDIRALDPLDRDFRGRERSNWKDIVENDLMAIRKSDVMLANLWKRDQPYYGTSMEYVYAKLYGVPVVTVMSDSGITVTGDKLRDEIRKSGASFHPWIQYHSLAVVHDLDAAVDVIVDLRDRLKGRMA
jgi:nucleoside 2-deoxyribosyltransferase